MILKGGVYSDHRGIITFNNDFDVSKAKRIYTIENSSLGLVRGWQGHKIEQRWFAVIVGRIEISVIRVDCFENPNPNLEVQKYVLSAESLSFLHVDQGCITAIKAVEEGSKLLVLADYSLGEIVDEYRYPLEYFKNF